MSKVRPALLIVALLAGTSAAAEETAACAGVTIPVVALAPGANPVRGLEPKHLQASVGRARAEIESVAPHVGEHRVLLLIEGSVLHSGEKWPPVRQLLSDMVRFARPETVLALATFTDAVQVHQPFGVPRDVQLQTLAELATKAPAKGAGRVLDSIHQALQVFGDPRVGDVVYVVTDGDHSHSHMRAQDVTAHLLKAGVRLFAIYFREQELPGGFGVVVSGPLMQHPGLEYWSPGDRDPAGIGGVVWETGGAVINLAPKVASMRFDLTGKRLERLQSLAAVNYRAISQFYDVKVKTGIRSAPVPFDLDMSASTGPLASVSLLQPRKLPACGP